MRRAESTAATHRAIVAAAREQLAEAPWREFTLDAVATRAGVTRVTVYNQVRNKAGLLDAVLTDVTGRAGMDRLLTAARELSADDALAYVVRQTCLFWAAERPVLRKLFALATMDDDVAADLARREGWRRDQLATLLDHDVDAAVAVTSFPTYDAMDTDPERAATLILRMVTALR
ncbi:TetR/AcrR family transcriptional regulator [Nucisporomicrobium flavum]|uniref:TetR/AcrR family transcriptional regulator n=1 Tax=Nucisporomicrobium flavum TaxID=2785915 RepID=UPI0018F472B2|nr:TetR/AcrR family transcriptional regulator [Nucisporomicrobium flavum]